MKIIVKSGPKNQKEEKRKHQIFLSVGVKTAKKAVKRNLLKRRIRAIIRPFIKEKNRNFLVIARPGAAELNYQELKKEIEEQIRKL